MPSLDERNNIINKANISSQTRQAGDAVSNTSSFLKEQLGKIMRIEFLIGQNILQERIGVLEEVGTNFVLLRALESDTLIYCDIHSIKFINIPTSNFSNQMNMGQMSNRYPYY